jgi:hypothetical protein
VGAGWKGGGEAVKLRGVEGSEREKSSMRYGNREQEKFEVRGRGREQ